MKCPKCGYLGYERVEKCRNCGYEFSLSATAQTPDLRLRDTGTVPQPLDDLDLIDAATPAPPVDRFNDLVPERSSPASADNGVAELPLFGPPITDDIPLITKASPPRPPLAVRRATPEVPRLRGEARAPLLDWNSEAGATAPPSTTPSSPVLRRQPSVASHARRDRADDSGTEAAGLGPRALAAAIDILILAIVDVIVVYLSLKICRLSFSEISMLPKAPMLTFLLLQNGGYLVAFTATGQTLGKMIAGVRVLADDSDAAPDVGRCALRTIVWFILALPAGLGLLTALFASDGRGLHDRFAGTRVVRAGA